MRQRVVGVIIPTEERFIKWVRTWGIPDEKYIHINHINKSRGHIFSKVLKSKDWYTIDNAEEILKDVICSIR